MVAFRWHKGKHIIFEHSRRIHFYVLVPLSQVANLPRLLFFYISSVLISLSNFTGSFTFSKSCWPYILISSVSGTMKRLEICIFTVTLQFCVVIVKNVTLKWGHIGDILWPVRFPTRGKSTLVKGAQVKALQKPWVNLPLKSRLNLYSACLIN